MKEVFPELTEDVLARMAGATPRLREVMTLLIRHLHSFVREAALSQDEWRTGIDFLTRTGQMCSETRQEFILDQYSYFEYIFYNLYFLYKILD